jgi:hypothetical protein
MAPLLALLACAPQVVAPPPVPPPQAEAQPLPPISADVQVWRPGHWEWDGRGYFWIPGEYQVKGNLSGQYQQGHWEQAPNGWVWVPWRWL